MLLGAVTHGCMSYTHLHLLTGDPPLAEREEPAEQTVAYLTNSLRASVVDLAVVEEVREEVLRLAAGEDPVMAVQGDGKKTHHFLSVHEH